MRRGLALAALLPMLAVVAVGRAAPPQDPARAVREVHEGGDYPNDLSVFPSDEGDGSVAGAEHDLGAVPLYGERRASRPRTRETECSNDSGPMLPSTPFASPVIAHLLLGLVIVALVSLFVAVLVRGRLTRAHRGPNDAPLPDAPTNAPLDPLLIAPELSPEELARLGRYGEAVHALLVRGLTATGWAPTGRASSFTAREIVQTLAQQDPRQAPLASLLARTELVWFGRREATRETYEAALAEHDAVVTAGGGTT